MRLTFGQKVSKMIHKDLFTFPLYLLFLGKNADMPGQGYSTEYEWATHLFARQIPL